MRRTDASQAGRPKNVRWGMCQDAQAPREECLGQAPEPAREEQGAFPRLVREESRAPHRQHHGAQGRFFVTPHAVQRYQERYFPDMSYERARDDLIRITSAGSKKADYRGIGKLREMWPEAQLEIWRGPRIGTHARQDRRSRLRFIVGYASGGDLPQVVTVL